MQRNNSNHQLNRDPKRPSLNYAGELHEPWMQVRWKPALALGSVLTVSNSLFISSGSAASVSRVCFWTWLKSIQYSVPVWYCFVCFVCVVMAIWLRAPYRSAWHLVFSSRPDWCSKRPGSNHDNRLSTSVQVPLIGMFGFRGIECLLLGPLPTAECCFSIALYFSSLFVLTVWTVCARCSTF